MRKLEPNELIRFDGFHEYQVIDGEWYETTDEYHEILPDDSIEVRGLD